MTLPVPTQRTWTVGDIVTAAEMNANVRDAVNFLENPPIFIGTQSSPQSPASGSFVAVTFDAETVDTYNGHSTTTNNSRYVAAVAGWYLVVAQVGLVANTTGFRAPCLFVNGVAPGTGIMQSQLSPSQSGNTLIQVAGMVFLNATDYVEVRIDQTSGGALSTYAAGCFMAVLWVHA
jgi:hypothetical protein